LAPVQSHAVNINRISPYTFSSHKQNTGKNHKMTRNKPFKNVANSNIWE